MKIIIQINISPPTIKIIEIHWYTTSKLFSEFNTLTTHLYIISRLNRVFIPNQNYLRLDLSKDVVGRHQPSDNRILCRNPPSHGYLCAYNFLCEPPTFL